MASMGEGRGYRRAIVTDDPDLRVPSVEMVYDDLAPLSPVRASRRAKLMPHRYFPDADWCIYVDNRLTLDVRPVDIVRHAQTQFSTNSRTVKRMAFRHSVRKTPFEELDRLYSIGIISRSDWKTTNDLFLSAGLQSDDLTMNPILVQKMGDDATDELNERWYEVFLTLPARDQLALPLVEHTLGRKLARSPEHFSTFVTWPAIPRRNRATRLLRVSDRKPKLFTFSRIGYKFRKIQSEMDIRSAQGKRNPSSE
ncbi:Protein of unknown function [Roseivivax sediminis]|uniref:TOD1/MUCI70 glycosyltransferase-like domain-containing protein n=2 Tax=Roseivivax sediminis TaxID=936889 RepID=A0A1I1XN88_9RHOB|nr:Protein of unknown function [Roseivivax sediminis]